MKLVNHFLEATVRSIAGFMCIVAGAIGLFLPIIPGMVLIFIGLILLGWVKIRQTAQVVTARVKKRIGK